MFLWHYPWGYPHWALPSTLPCGARTFLKGGLSAPALAVIQSTHQYFFLPDTYNNISRQFCQGLWQNGVCQDNSGTFPSEVIYCIFLVEDWIT